MKKTQREYKVIDFPPLTAEERTILEEMASRPTSEINCDDIPDSAPNSKGDFYYIQPVEMPKTDIRAKIDSDNLAWLKQAGRGYQKRLNSVLRWARQNNCPIATL